MLKWCKLCYFPLYMLGSIYLISDHLPLDIIELAAGRAEFVSLPLCSDFTYTRQQHQISQRLLTSLLLSCQANRPRKIICEQQPITTLLGNQYAFRHFFYSLFVREYLQQHRQNLPSSLLDKATLRGISQGLVCMTKLEATDMKHRVYFEHADEIMTSLNIKYYHCSKFP